jgi:small subunit ribosomal protein S8
MSHDIVADALNQIKNAGKAGKKKIVINRHSKLLMKIFEIMKERKYLEDYKTEIGGKNVEVTLGKIVESKAIKPRFTVKKENILKYMKRYLPAKNYGVLLISTPQGLMTHDEVLQKKIGGSLIAVLY